MSEWGLLDYSSKTRRHISTSYQSFVSFLSSSLFDKKGRYSLGTFVNGRVVTKESEFTKDLWYSYSVLPNSLCMEFVLSLTYM